MNVEVNLLMSLLGIAPSCLIWLRERRFRRLSEARLNIAICVTEMEQMMLDGKIRGGQVSHDVVFKIMQHAQNTHRYPVTWNFFRENTPRQEEVRKALVEELSQPDCGFSEYLGRYIGAY